MILGVSSGSQKMRVKPNRATQDMIDPVRLLLDSFER